MENKASCILLVDDDPGTNLINNKIIDNSGVAQRVVVKRNGEEAFDFIVEADGMEEGLTLILLDINMPVMDGWEFLDAFDSLPAGRKDRYRIVMLTTSFHPEDKLRAEGHSAIMKYVIKPLTPEKFGKLFQKFAGES